jgi:DNA-binding response OmpR family regulator
MAFERPPRPVFPRHLHLVSDDPDFERSLSESLVDDDDPHAIARRPARMADEPSPGRGVVIVDAGIPQALVTSTIEKLQTGGRSPLIVLVAAEIDAEVRELGKSLGAVAYLKKDTGLQEIAALVAELSSLPGPALRSER